MFTHRTASLVLAAAGLALAAPAPAQLSNADGRDMACFVAMSMLGQKLEKEGKTGVPIQNLKFALAYYGGKIAARHPGGNVPAIIQGSKAGVQAALKGLDGKACLEEVGRSLKDRKPG